MSGTAGVPAVHGGEEANVRVLSTRQLNRALLARQLLLKRSPQPLTRTLERLAGLQAQYAPSTYISLWSRLREFPRDALTRALERRRAVQATLMRSTIHVVSARDFWLFAAGIRAGRQRWWLRVQRHQVEGLDMQAAAACLRAHLAAGPRRAAELKELLRAEGLPPVAWSGVGLWLELVRVPPSGTWERRRADLYGLAEDWLGPASATEAEGEGGRVRLEPFDHIPHLAWRELDEEAERLAAFHTARRSGAGAPSTRHEPSTQPTGSCLPAALGAP